MSYLKLSNANVLFDEEILIWKTHTINEALLITKQAHIINKKNFIIATLNIDNKTFMMHMAIWEQEKMPVHFKKQA